MGPGLPRNYATDELAGAQLCHQTMLPKILHGPSSVPKYFCQWSRMGPALAPNYGTDDLAWAQACHQTMLPMSLHGPSTGTKLWYRWSLHGPSTGTKLWYRWSHMGPGLPPNYATDELAWAQHWHKT